jgi:hypothetical protein
MTLSHGVNPPSMICYIYSIRDTQYAIRNTRNGWVLYQKRLNFQAKFQEQRAGKPLPSILRLLFSVLFYWPAGDIHGVGIRIHQLDVFLALVAGAWGAGLRIAP